VPDQGGVILGPGEGRTIPLGPHRATVKVERSRTGDRYSVVEYSSAPGRPGTPPHRHEAVEGFYVLEGEVEFRLGPATAPGYPGTFFFAPPWVAHGFRNSGPGVARLLVVAPPGGPEFLADLSAVLPEDGPPDAERILEVWRRRGIHPADS
jgi:mannose-6-phosphate isomerase-like protein (cupin superfamily)